ncbi:mechanosensitive ion channel family protein [Leptolyngbya sp. FACHB-16]|nr:mechanosensitive ion channel family protein [Leptolyngbya sp. FACHB-8]MBD2158511.1 mechanosensitive ion channel family protein [Leptolyngbya sp. FACHB-16]
MIATFLLVLTIPAVALAQFPPIQTDNNQPPTGVVRQGLIEVTDLELDGRDLFTIAAPTVYNRADPGTQVPVEERARQIETTLRQLTARAPEGERSPSQTHVTVLDPESLKVFYETVNGLPVIFADDDYLAEAKVLVTVTNTDAEYQGIPRNTLAERWQDILQKRLYESLRNRQPDAFRAQMKRALALAIAILVLSLLFLFLRRVLGKRKEAMEALQVNQATGNTAEIRLDGTEVPWPLRFGRPQQQLSLQRRLQLVSLFRWLMLWLVGFVWVVGVAATLYTFPQTRGLALSVVSTPALILGAWFMTGLLNRLLDVTIDRLTDVWEEGQDESLTQAELQRILTISTAFKGLKTFLVYAFGVLWVLQRLSLVPGSVLALGALLALTLSFTAQSLVKDMINGFLILLEDHYGIGDQITVGTVTGIVENLTLRVTQIRTDNGNLVTIPNSLINQVENMSRTWARCNFVIDVAYDTDVDRALAIVREEAHRMAEDEEWRSLILNPEELLGVDNLSHTGIRIRLWMRTLPLKQWAVGRELRLRLKRAFDAYQVQIGVPQQLLMGEVSGLIQEDEEQHVDLTQKSPKSPPKLSEQGS